MHIFFPYKNWHEATINYLFFFRQTDDDKNIYDNF